jgi:hypothetical protein
MAKKRKSKKQIKSENIFRRSLFYAVCLFAVFEFMLVLLQLRSYVNFWIVFVIGFSLVIFELLYSKLNEYMKPFSKYVKHWRKKIWRESFLQHVVLPILFYVSGSLFLFYNRIRVLDQIAVIMLTGGFLMLFNNISGTHKKIYSITRDAKYIFDFMNIVVFYFFVDILVNSVFYYLMPEYIVYIGSMFISFVLIIMMVVMFQQFNLNTLVFAFISSVFILLVSVGVMMVPVLNIATLSLLVTVGFYLVDVFWHHRLEGTYDSDTMSQYIIFAIMVIILLLYL